jgi:fatty-acyl-CoA synthase
MHSRIKIVDGNGDEVPRGTPGEIWFKGLAITPGYWRNPKANAESFTDGWFHSGDIGIMDKDGYVSIEDRVKDMYISGGENVYPAEIEGLLYELDQVVEVAVIGVKDDRWGETGCVCAGVKEGESLSLADVLAHLDSRMAKFKLPSHLHTLAELPRGGTGKVLKFELRKSVPKALGL